MKFPETHLILTTPLILLAIPSLATPLFGDTIGPIAQPKHKGADYGVEDCPKTICQDADTKLCRGLHTGDLDPMVPIYMGDAPARWRDCEKLLQDIKSDPPKRLFLDGDKHDAGGDDYTRIAGNGKCAIGFKAGDGTPGNSFLALSAADAEVLFRTAKQNEGKRVDDEDRLYAEGHVTCGRHTIDWVIKNGEKQINEP